MIVAHLSLWSTVKRGATSEISARAETVDSKQLARSDRLDQVGVHARDMPACHKPFRDAARLALA
jgi:hypothetical protein